MAFMTSFFSIMRLPYHAVAVGVVPDNQGVPGGNRYREGAAHRNVLAVGVPQNAGERIRPSRAGCGDRIGKIGFPQQAEPHFPAVDRYRIIFQAAGDVAESGGQGFRHSPKPAVSAGGDHYHNLACRGHGRRGEGPDGPPGCRRSGGGG